MKHIQYDIRLFLFLLVVSFVSVYLTPMIINRLIFLSLLMLIFFTKHDYVFFSWVFVLYDAPGRLFSAGSIDEVARIPFYTITSGISISFWELFIIAYLIKILINHHKTVFVFKKEFTWFLIYGIIVFGYSFFIGINQSNIINSYRALLPWSFVFIIPTFIRTRSILIRSTLLLFPFVFIAFFSLIFSYITGSYLEGFLRGSDSMNLRFVVGEGYRSYSSAYITLLAIFLSFYFLLFPRKTLRNSYLILVSSIGYLTIFLSSTRGWIIALALLFFSTIFVSSFIKGNRSKLRISIITITASIVLITQLPIVKNQLEASINRLTTLESLVAGDITAGGTLKRLDVRGPRVLGKFSESPVIGWGFSDDYYDYSDGHVGHHNILLNTGILGYVFVNVIYLIICFKTLRRAKWVSKKWGNNAIYILLFSLIVVLIIHSSSTQFWGYDMYFDQLQKTTFFGFLFSLINVALSENEISMLGKSS